MIASDIANAYSGGWTTPTDAAEIRTEQQLLSDLRARERSRFWSRALDNLIAALSVGLIVAVFVACCLVWGAR